VLPAVHEGYEPSPPASNIPPEAVCELKLHAICQEIAWRLPGGTERMRRAGRAGFLRWIERVVDVLMYRRPPCRQSGMRRGELLLDARKLFTDLRNLGREIGLELVDPARKIGDRGGLRRIRLAARLWRHDLIVDAGFERADVISHLLHGAGHILMRWALQRLRHLTGLRLRRLSGLRLRRLRRFQQLIGPMAV
jgi:hypothetical protein